MRNNPFIKRQRIASRAHKERREIDKHKEVMKQCIWIRIYDPKQLTTIS